MPVTFCDGSPSRHSASADSLLARHFRSRAVDLLLDWVWFIAGYSWRLRQRTSARGTLGDVHVDRSYRADLVRLRLGDSTAGDGLLVHLSLPITRRAAIS